MKNSAQAFGALPDGRATTLYTISNQAGMTVALSDYGARIVRLLAPDQRGALADVALGYDGIEPYIDNDECHGAVCGRVANRIAGGRFSLGGKQYQVPKNAGDVALHGGINGLHRRLWHAEPLPGGVHFSYYSEDGEEGFPGGLQLDVLYLLGEDNILSIHYEAVSDADTFVNLTNHTYFNLAGHGSGDIHDQLLQVFASFYTPVDAALLPTGEVRAVAGTPFDFRQAKPIGRDIDADCPQLRLGGGYDHNFVLDKPERDVLSLAARAVDPASGRAMEVWTTQPGMQLYTSNFLSDQPGKDGARYTKRAAYCLETQCFPDAMTHTHFPSPVLRANVPMSSRTEFRFR
jgi:aldose 1-epimerase